jgi:hypothetical protein
MASSSRSDALLLLLQEAGHATIFPQILWKEKKYIDFFAPDRIWSYPDFDPAFLVLKLSFRSGKLRVEEHQRIVCATRISPKSDA